jgi:hypothetical protein
MATSMNRKPGSSDTADDETQVVVTTVQDGGAQTTAGSFAVPQLTAASDQVQSSDFASIMQSITWGALSRFDSQLAALQLSTSSMAAAAAPFTSTVEQFSGAISPDARYVVIDATARDGNGAALLDQLETLGLLGGGSFGAMASGWMPIDQLGAMASLDDLQFARESMMMSHAGSVTTQADHSLLSDIARGSFAVNGSGVKVGVISDSFNYLNGYSADVATGNLPAGVQVLQDSGTTDEGRGMAQIVYDIAPGASLAFATANGGQANFANNIIALANAGAKIIVDDVSYFLEPMFQDGIIAQAINQVVAAGVTYFSAAANNGHKGYEAAFVAGSSQIVGGKAETFHAFSAGNIFMPFTLAAGRTATVVLEWNQPAASVSPGHASASDLDLFITDNTHVIVAGSTANNVGNDPIEGVQITNNTGTTQTYDIVVGLASGIAPSDFKVVTYNGNGTVSNNFASNTNDGTIYGHEAAAGAIAVGAAYYAQTPAYGVNPPVVESFSSAGPTRILFDTAGNPVNIVRQGPAFTAPDGGDTSFFGGSDSDGDGFPNFFGTSAAAPAAAAVAALMLQANPSLSPAVIKALLMNSAIDMDNPATAGFDVGFDAGTGAGLIQADRAIQNAIGGTASISINDVSVSEGNGLTTATFTVTRSGGTGAFSVNFATSDGTATVGNGDYLPNSGTLQFGAGVNTRTIDVLITGDGRVEPDETFFVTLSGATSGAVIADNLGIGTILNDDINLAPVVTAAQANVMATPGQAVQVSSLFSANDANADPLTYYLYDATLGGGHFMVNGNIVPEQTIYGVTAAQFSQATFVAAAAGRSDDIYVEAFDGQAYSGWNGHVHLDVPGSNTPPIVSLPSGANVHAAAAGQSYQISQLFIGSDVDNDPLTYFLFDDTASATSGHFSVNGSVVPAATIYQVSAAQLAQTTFVAGALGTFDDLYVESYDGIAYSGWSSHVHLTVGGVNHAPTVSLPAGANASVTVGQTLQLASLFSGSDIDGDTLSYFVYDANVGASSGHFVVGGNTVAAQTITPMSAAQLATATFVAGAAGTADDIYVEAFDGNLYSGWNSSVHVAVAGTNHAPTVNLLAGSTANPAPGQSLQLSSLFSGSDPDGNALSYYVYDANPAANSGHFVVGGNTVTAQTITPMSAAQLATATFVAGTAGSADDIYVEAFDGQLYSGWNTSVHVFV